MIRPAALSSLTVALFGALLLSPGVSIAQEKTTKKQVSANGTYTIFLRQDPDKSCRVVVTREGKPHWQLQQCVGDTGDLLFISNDGERFWVIRTLAPMKKKRKRNPWAASVVAVLYDREGRQRAKRTAGQLVPRIGIPRVRALGGHVKWLEGVLGVPGKPPRVTEENLLAFETVGPGYVKLSFNTQGKAR